MKNLHFHIYFKARFDWVILWIAVALANLRNSLERNDNERYELVALRALKLLK
jgi:hypothetical protein